MHSLYSCTCHECQGLPSLAAADELPELAPVWDTLLKNVYDGIIEAGDIDTATALHMAKDFMQAVTDGYGKTIADVAYDSPDYLMLERMEKDVFRFSAAKSYQINQELTRLLKSGDQVREFTDWRREAMQHVDTWINSWQQSEHITCISTSQNNADYLRFKANADTMPLLQRSGVGDMRECPICSEYDDIIAPIDSPVWSYAYGDLHYRDRCRMLQLASGTATPADQLPSADAIPEPFRVNLAEKMLAFPPGHPYYEGVPKKLLKRWVQENAPNHE